MKQVRRVGLILISGIFIGYLALSIVFLLPTGRMYNNALESVSTFQEETTQNTLIKDGTLTTKTDNYTDALMILSAVDDSDKNIFTRAINIYHASEEEKEPTEVLTNLNQVQEHNSYGRYWHGYLLFLKPLLLFFDYDQIRVILSIIVIVLVIAVIYLMQKKKLDKYILSYVIATALIYPIAISLSMQFLSVFAVSNLAIILILLFFEKIEKTQSFFCVFLIIGMATCYFDLLTYPILSLGFPLVIYLLLKGEQKIQENIKLIIRGSIGWGVGYLGIWVGKWAIGSLITGNNLFQSAIGAADDRISTITPLEQISRFDPIWKSFEMIFTEPVMFILILLVVLGIILFITGKIKINKHKALSNIWLLLISIFPFLWYVVLANHSLWHMFFTYRAAGVFVFAAGCYIISIVEKTKKENRNGQNRCFNTMFQRIKNH